jgi:signal transduction histidine kinase
MDIVGIAIERRHIARELHDSAGQTLAALGMNLAQLAQDTKNNPAQAKGIADAESLVQHLSREIRTTSYLLHPPLLDESGLSSALNWYVEGLKKRGGLDVDLRIPDNFGRLPADMELVIFRIVQESLTNVHRHSGSKSASIRVAREADKIIVEIQDQGDGMFPEKLAEIQSQGSGVGISGMRERLRHFDGELLIESNGTGTTIVATLLLKSFPATQLAPVGEGREIA